MDELIDLIVEDDCIKVYFQT